jgi:hypothetical protein
MNGDGRPAYSFGVDAGQVVCAWPGCGDRSWSHGYCRWHEWVAGSLLNDVSNRAYR